MKKIEINLEELSNLELEEITGGGFFYDMGVAAHEAWNSVNDFFNSHPNLKSHSRQGI
ncbi:hypothetical protein QWY99_21000 [Flavobacterium branchiarum]|uniref:Bacteriocin n=1 Tax=Flavobacterium branchiarum TaxID=1114870 RepID=A0ABV5FPJ6_9FLAO|nr:hypothetical protein [Flavobacterium branchiarum]MDN3675514.1 hypothetical protein [Flavobacterium branchiarum]